jgi:hypothetical protein
VQDGGLAGSLGGADVASDRRRPPRVDDEHRQPLPVAVAVGGQGVQQQANPHQQHQQEDGAV